MALQLKYDLISRKWQFKFLPLDVPFCIAKVTPLYVECDHTDCVPVLNHSLLDQKYWLFADLVVHCKSKTHLWTILVIIFTQLIHQCIDGLIVLIWSLSLFKGMFRFSFAQNEFSLLAAIAYFIVKREWDRKGADRISSTESEIKRVQKGYHQVVCRQGWHLGGAVSRAMMLSEGKCIQQCTLIGLQSNTM